MYYRNFDIKIGKLILVIHQPPGLHPAGIFTIENQRELNQIEELSKIVVINKIIYLQQSFQSTSIS